MSQENVAIVRRANEALNRGDIETMLTSTTGCGPDRPGIGSLRPRAEIRPP